MSTPRASELVQRNNVLTNVAIGYSNEEYIWKYLFPPVKVPDTAGRVPKFGKEMFVTQRTERAMRGPTNLANPEGITTIPYSTQEHDMAYPIDYKEMEIAQQSAVTQLKYESTLASNCMEVIRLGLENDVGTIAQTIGNYASGNSTTLSGGSQWSHADSDPADDVAVGKAAIRADIMREPNVMVMGYATWLALKNNASLKALISSTATKLVTIDFLKEVFEIQHIYVGKALTADPVTYAGTDIWGKNAILAYVPQTSADQASIYTPAFAYTYQYKMPWSDKYFETGNKIKYVRCTEDRVPLIVGNDAGYFIADATA